MKNIAAVTGEDPGFRFFQTDAKKDIPLNLSKSRIWIIDASREKILTARELYFEHRCAKKLKSRNWEEAKKNGSGFRYRLGGINSPSCSDIGDWQHLAQVLTAEGVNYFFNRSVYDSLFQKDDIQYIVEELYAGIIRERTKRSDRTPISCIVALICLHNSGCVLLPTGWISPRSELFDNWPGFQGTLTALLNISDEYFDVAVRKELEDAKANLKVAEAKGGNKKRKKTALLAIKLILQALPPTFKISEITGDMFIAVVDVQIRIRDKFIKTGAISRDRHISDLRLIWNAIAPYRLTLPSADEETRKVRAYITSFVTRTGTFGKEDYGRKRGHQMRKRGDLNWVTDESPHLAGIVDLAREYVSTGTAYISATLSRGFDKFLEYMIDRPDSPTELHMLKREDFRQGGVCCQSNGGYPSFIDYLRSAEDLKRNLNKGSNKGSRSDTQMNQILNATLNFLEWYRDYKKPDYQVPLFRSDIPEQARGGWNNGKSTKLPVPVRVLNICRKILTEDNYAWPRTLESDYAVVTLPDGRTQRVWCPVRAIAMLMLFSLPLRSVSVRRLDSGEGDEYLFDRESGEWKLNDLPTMEKGRSVGIIHQILDTDGTGKPLGGFFINSNKTRNADVKLTSSRGPNKSAFSFGYIIPWNNFELFGHIAFCRDWQTKNNPISEPRGLDSVAEHSMRVTAAVAGSLPDYYFLFRDPNAANEPISSHKLNAMFKQVLEEASRRLSIEYEQEISLSHHFSLHSLRVGGITAFMKSGMPLGVLTEFIAGHSTIIMNLYYQKHSAPEISDIISKAAENLENGDLLEEDLLDRVAQISEDITYNPDGAFTAGGLVFQDKMAFDYLRKSQKGLVLVDIDGCCPVGGSMCDLGGPANTRGEAGFNLLGIHGCATCRFHVTGEPFLAGMVIKANEAIYKLRSLAKAIQDLESRVAGCLNQDSAGLKRMLQGRLDSLNMMAEQTMAEWASRVQSIMMTTGQIRYEKKDDKAAGRTVLMAKDNIVFEEGSEFRLTDFLARTTDLVKLDPVLTEAVKLRRKVLLNKLLTKNGIESLLMSVPDQIAQKSACGLVDMMVEAVGWEGVDSAMTGQVSLQELGFDVTGFDQKGLPSLSDLKRLN